MMRYAAQEITTLNLNCKYSGVGIPLMIVYYCIIPNLLFAVQSAPYPQMNAIAPQKYTAVVGSMIDILVSSLFFLLV